MERCAPRGKFLIARSDQRGAEAREFGMAGPIVREKRFNRRAVGQLDGVFRVTYDFLEASKEKHLYTRGLCREVHPRIVTRRTITGYSLRG
jgi:hypothetical protein